MNNKPVILRINLDAKQQMKQLNKMWRPKDWENPYIGECCVEGGGETCEIAAYEAGADAMLEALRKQHPYDELAR